MGALVGVARAFRDDADVAAFLREFGDFLANEWSKYAWLKMLATVEQRFPRGLNGSMYVLMELRRLPERAFRKYRYESPRGYTVLLGVWELGAYLGICASSRLTPGSRPTGSSRIWSPKRSRWCRGSPTGWPGGTTGTDPR